MDVNFAPASGCKPQQLQATAFDLYDGTYHISEVMDTVFCKELISPGLFIIPG